MSVPSAHLPTDAAGLPTARETPRVAVSDGETTTLRIAPIAKGLGDTTLRMLAYNGSVPGPLLEVSEGSEIAVDVENHGDVPATVHWHGLRLDSRYDGTHETQEPIPVGGSFRYRLEFPDPGIYWYHPHVRQDYGQELGLYGTILVKPADPDYWPPAHRELVVTLDDILVEDGQIVPFDRDETTHAAMGRYGNHMLVNGQPELALSADAGEVVRFYLVNTANARVFNVGMRGATMKLVGGDSGGIEHEQFVESVMLAPSERAVVDVRFDTAGEAVLEHRSPDATRRLASIAVGDAAVDPAASAAFDTLRTNADLVAQRERITRHRDRAPDKTISFVAEMEGGHHHHHPGDGGGPEPIEWEDGMGHHSAMTTSSNTRWKILGDTDWKLTVGDQLKLRIVNELESDHPMHHPFHIHGAGRFLVLSRDGVEDPNLVWTDTVLVRNGEVVEILLDVTHPGRWMAHCHIAEHHESGMMFSFDVAPAATERSDLHG